MQWAGTYEVLRMYQRELQDAAERDRLIHEAARAKAAQRRMAWSRILHGLLSNGGR
jgi:hypothetical protein